jgi:hypothetical protein
MALFQYFPKNYVWNLSVAIALESGAQIGEIEDMCRPLLDAAARGEDAGTGEFLAQWVAMADKLVALADEDSARGRGLSASRKLDRASLYYQIAERMQGHGHPGRADTYGKALSSFARSVEQGRRNYRRVEIPYRRSIAADRLRQRPGLDQGDARVVRAAGGAGGARRLDVVDRSAGNR